MRTIVVITSIGMCVAAMATAGCGGTSLSPDVTTGPSASSERAQSEPSPATEAPGEQAAQQWVMPNLVGLVLQDAQDQVQTMTGDAVYFTESHDLTGQDRNQVLDANWKVCTQNIEPGRALMPTSRIDFGVVEIDESCS